MTRLVRRGHQGDIAPHMRQALDEKVLEISILQYANLNPFITPQAQAVNQSPLSTLTTYDSWHTGRSSLQSLTAPLRVLTSYAPPLAQCTACDVVLLWYQLTSLLSKFVPLILTILPVAPCAMSWSF